MRIIGHRHTGIIVQDFDTMLEFYMGLGLTLRRRDLEEGPFIDKLLNVDGIVLETAKLILEDDRVPVQYKFNLELIKIQNSGVMPPKKSGLQKFDFMERQSGVLDIAFTVDNMESVLDYITSHGGDLISAPLKTESGFPALHCYARDPEGNVLHIAQNL